jgi:hypothetical protein
MTSTRIITRSCALALATLTLSATAPAAFAQPYDNGYADSQADYAAQQAQYQQARRDYDARYGGGAYDRYYHDHPAYPGYRACEHKKANNEVAGTLLGGIAGAVVGSNLAHGGGRTGGAVIGGVAGAAIGNTVGRSSTDCG